ncbi:ATP-binding protein [Pseudomonas putida]|uniref:ATP-binding protein n=1 Tax=Pseudomonas putida TaxID=303 RepID=A0A7Y8D4W1_PSEPU|nr:ATP-binding protein [Pseudomonas putida]NWC84064.1 ATP-binding protein [Pseudomonas putida]
MPPSTDDKAAIIRYWHAVELLSPQTAPAPNTKERASPNDTVVLDLSRGGAITPPWSPQSPLAKMTLPKQRAWSHLVYGHCFDYRLIVSLLEQTFGADNAYRETRESITGLYAVRFTAEGKMVADSFVLSSAAWLAGRVLGGKDWLSGFEAAQNTAAEIAGEALEGVVTAQALEVLSDKILSYLSLADFFAAHGRRYICASTPLRPNAEPTDDPLNSFILDDLAKVTGEVARGNVSAPLNAYLARHEGSERIDLKDDASSGTQCALLAVGRYPAGCWPTPGDLGLVHSQQLAVNAIHDRLQKGEGLLSVNGPPGTGKTTLLRDIVSAVVTARADALARLASSADAFLQKGTVVDADKNRGYWSLHPDLLGHEIVIGSSNNGAIENVTLELPQADKVDASWLDEYDLYPEIAELVSGQPAWGLISAPLGSKSRRSAFVAAFWNGVPKRKAGAALKSVEQKPSAAGAGQPDDEVNIEVGGGPVSAGGDLSEGTGQASPAEAPGNKASAAGIQKQKKGMEAWLNDQRKDYSAVEKADLWRQAVQRYLDAKREADKACVDAQRIGSLLSERHKICADMPRLQQALADGATEIRVVAQAVTDKDQEGLEAAEQLGAALNEVAELMKRRPGFWDNLFSFGQAGRRWAQEEGQATAQRDLAQRRCRRIDREMETLHQQVLQQKTARAEAKAAAEHAHQAATRLTDEAIALAERYGAEHLRTLIKTSVIGRGEAIELAEPWKIPGWRRAKARVFLEAMRLHQTLFQLESSRVFTNLTLANAVIEGQRYQNIPQEAVRSVWGTLFMAVPVVSSTFASFGRCFSTMGAGDIGWLLVDEAGQASPQQAVGALWRARRVVMVGDPLQLEPINQVPSSALEHMRRGFGVAEHWMPHQLSAQRLADMANPIGKEIGPEGDKVWVGLPLVVHRRCDRPMFEVANRIAYSGGMVYGTSPRVSGTPLTLPTGWVQVSGTSQGNWVPSEGRALNRLVTLLTLAGVDPKSIAVVTPFGDVARQVAGSQLARAGATCGTVHTMQGKEAACVVLVLGGNADPQRPGAREWAVSKPNLLNVAVTRAKQRLYVIGDRADWAKRRYFNEIMDLLPLVDVEAALAAMEGSASVPVVGGGARSIGDRQ